MNILEVVTIKLTTVGNLGSHCLGSSVEHMPQN